MHTFLFSRNKLFDHSANERKKVLWVKKLYLITAFQKHSLCDKWRLSTCGWVWSWSRLRRGEPADLVIFVACLRAFCKASGLRTIRSSVRKSYLAVAVEAIWLMVVVFNYQTIARDIWDVFWVSIKESWYFNYQLIYLVTQSWMRMEQADLYLEHLFRALLLKMRILWPTILSLRENLFKYVFPARAQKLNIIKMLWLLALILNCHEMSRNLSTSYSFFASFN